MKYRIMKLFKNKKKQEQQYSPTDCWKFMWEYFCTIDNNAKYYEKTYQLIVHCTINDKPKEVIEASGNFEEGVSITLKTNTSYLKWLQDISFYDIKIAINPDLAFVLTSIEIQPPFRREDKNTVVKLFFTPTKISD